MAHPTKSTPFSRLAFIAIGFCFLILFHRFIIAPGNWHLFPRIVGALLLPLPLSLLASYIWIAKASLNHPQNRRPTRLLLILVISFALTWIATHLLTTPLNTRFGESFPLIAQSSAFSASILNYRGLRNESLAAALCGISTAIASAIIFLT